MTGTARVIRGDALALPLPDRFWRRVEFGDDCWTWITPQPDGYGRFQIGWVRKRAHRWTWEAVNGPVPDGLVIDHLCRNRSCVNPGHMRAVTPYENTHADGSGAIAKVHAAKTECPHGHPYDDVNTLIDYRGRRRCRTCVNAARRHKRASA